MQQSQPVELLNRKFVVPAALCSLATAAVYLASAAATFWMRDRFAAFLAIPVENLMFSAAMTAITGAVMAAGSVMLLRNVVSAQRMLLVIHVALAAIAVALLVHLAFLKSVPWAVMAGLALSAFSAWLLIEASAPRSRLRYGTMACVSIGAAIAVVVVVNLVAQQDSYRRSMERLGQYRLSDRTRKILSEVRTPVRISAVYSSARARKTPQFLDRVKELLEEMRRSNGMIEYTDASSDAAKAQLLARLGGLVTGEAQAHDALLREFQQKFPELLSQLKTIRQQWAAVADDENSFLSNWDSALELRQRLDQAVETLEDMQSKIKRGLAGSAVADYGAMTSPLADALRTTVKDLNETSEDLSKLQALPESVATNKDHALAALKAVNDAAAALTQLLPKDKPASAPADSQEALKPVLAAMDSLASAAAAAGETLENLGGAGNKELMQQFSPLGVVVMAQTPDGTAVPARLPLGSFYRQIARRVLAQKNQVRAAGEALKSEAMSRVQVELRRWADDIAGQFTQASQHAKAGIEQLGKLDQPSADLLAKVKDKTLFAEALATLTALNDQASKLPALKEQKLSRELSDDDIVIVECGDKVRVVSFDDIWPLKIQDRMSMAPAAADTPEIDRHTFNGDAAISSRILALTHSPFARVLLAYAPPPPELMQRIMQMPRYAQDVPLPMNYRTLRSRLEAANFTVRNWDLDHDLSAALIGEDKDEMQAMMEPQEPQSQPATASMPAGMPTVLLVLPSMMPMTPQQEERLKQAIDGGASAIFLTGFDARESGPSPVLDYLRADWGIDARTGFRVVAGIPDQATPGRYEIDIVRFHFLPLSTFGPHVAAKPLQGRRMIWTDVCPVMPAANGPPGVQVATLLSVESYGSLWATSNIEEIGYKIRYEEGGYLTPQWGMQDLPAPFPVALAATRSAAPGRAAARIAVLGMGRSFIEPFLTEQVPQLRGSGLSYEPAPLADTDVIVNSVYWMADKPAMIAAGPAMVRPVQGIANLTMVQVICMAGYPALIMAIGGLVMFIRRR